MFNLVQKRRWYFMVSGVIISTGLLIMLYSAISTGSAFRLSIDFMGGSIYDLRFTEPGATEEGIRQVFAEQGDDGVIIQRLGEPDDYRWSVRGRFLEDQQAVEAIIRELDTLAPVDTDSLRIERVSETVGEEVTRAALLATMVAAVIITGFIVLAFRQVPKAVRYGVCAIVAMAHDLLVVMTFASLMGLLFGWEIDALFLTAILTIVGFSVQDSIIVFDRIRENIPKHIGEPYEAIVNRSLWETIHRSLATQLNVNFVLVAILLFGGETLRQFIAVLLVGLLSGQFSSIFTAVPLLVSWEKGEIPLLKGDTDLIVADARA